MVRFNKEMLEELHIDIEARSANDLSACGVYKYVESGDFEILLFSYAINGGPVRTVDLASGEKIPEEILRALSDKLVIKVAFNCNFERVCLSAYLRKNYPQYFQADEDGYLDPRSWHDTMIEAAHLGLPRSLAGVGSVLKLSKEKMEEGKDLIRYFCVPYDSKKDGIEQTWHYPKDDPNGWELFKKYNARDVEVEMEIQERLSRFPVPDSMWEDFYLDQRINDRGVRIDRSLVEKAVILDEQSHRDIEEKFRELTGLENPRSTQKLKQWLADSGFPMGDLLKKNVMEAMKTAPDRIKKVLTLRIQGSKSSTKKYKRMAEVACGDGRARGNFKFYGTHTGRFSGGGVQLQNLPKNRSDLDLDKARTLVKAGDYEAVKKEFGDVPDLLSQLTRTAIIPEEGNLIFVADFSAIEARVLAWIAGEKWRMETFHAGEDIYCKSAETMFRVPVEKHGVNAELRQKGKIAELACGYGGSVGAMKAMGALDAGLSEDELKSIVDAWREASPHIVQFWWDIDRVIRNVLRDRTVEGVRGLKLWYESGMLIIRLPSGRELFYARPRLEMKKDENYGTLKECITYEEEANGKWERVESYGPKFVENIVQAVSRDILCCAMQSLDKQGYRIVAHVHDEIIIEASKEVDLKEICGIMEQTPFWADGLELHVEGFSSPYYKKDE